MHVTSDTEAFVSIGSISMMSMGPIGTKVSVWLSRRLKGGGREFTST
jgi:hypothetical protein